MLLPLKLTCKKNQARRDGTSIIKIQYCYTSNERTELPTEIAIPPEYWNRKSCRISDKLPDKYGNAQELNAKLQTMFRIAEDIITFALEKKVESPLEFAKNTFKPDFDPDTLRQQEKVILQQAETNLDVFFQIDDYIKSRQKKVSKSLITLYNGMKACLQAFQQHQGKTISFNSFDLSFREDFIDFLTYDYVQRRNKKKPIVGLKANSIRSMVNYLRGFLINRMNKSIIPRIDLTALKAPAGEESDAIYLNWEEIAHIYQTDLSDYPHLVDSRDTLVLGCLTGLRFSDYSTIRPEDIKKGFLRKKMEKTDHWVVIPLRTEAAEILDRFHGNVPRIDNGSFNDNIREIGQLAGLGELVRFSYKKGNQTIEEVKPKYEWMSSHTCRRSFCTNEFLAGTPVELIMKISGHKSLKDFYKYIRISPEEAGNRMKQLWQSRGDFNLVSVAKVS